MNFPKHVIPDFFSAFFMFPFSIRNNSPQKLRHLQEELPKHHWKPETYELRNGFEYNEYVYFYPYIWDILFTSRRQLQNEPDFESQGVLFFSYPIEDNSLIEVQRPTQTAIRLPVKNIFLHLFPIGVGILVFEIVHDATKPNPLPQDKQFYSLEDYLFFVNSFRRIYTPFLNTRVQKQNVGANEFQFASSPLDNLHTSSSSTVDFRPAKGAQEVGEIAPTVLILNEQTIPHGDPLQKFLWVGGEENIYKPQISPIIRHFLDMENIFTYATGDYSLIIDDRMFVHAYYSISDKRLFTTKKNGIERQFINYWNVELIRRLKQQFRHLFSPERLDAAADAWYQMIFIDWGGPSCRNPVMKSQLLQESSYPRWSDAGTFFGFSRFSSVIFSSITDVGFIYNHFQSMYYQIAVLLLFYRGALLNFSDQSERLSKTIHRIKQTSQTQFKKMLKDVEKLHRDFLLFRNRFWFREITAQDQGIEIFDLWSSKMRNAELMKDVEEEIKELFAYVNAIHEKNISNTVNILTILGSILLPLVILTSIFGMNLDFINNSNSQSYLPRVINKAILKKFGIFIPHNLVDASVFILLFILSLFIGIAIYKYVEKWVEKN